MDPKNNFDAIIDFDKEMASETDSRIPKNQVNSRFKLI
jgi:hypothetical protein